MYKIPVVFAINNNYVKQLATVIVSILKNSSKNNCFEFNILSNDLSNENKRILSSLSSLNKNTIFNFIDMNEITKNFDLEKFMSRRDDYKYISTETYFRFFIPEIFKNYSKILYLDADILVLQDLKQLYDTDIRDYYAGVVQDTVLEVFIADENIKTRTKPERIYTEYFREKLHKKDKSYFNAGILLLNLDKIREDNIVDKLWQFTAEESPLEFQDQDVLNAVLEGNVKFVDYKWNTLKDLNWFATQIRDKKKRRYLLSTYKKPGIFHYVGGNKPWMIHEENYNYACIEEWWKYYKLTSLFDESDKLTLKKIKKKRIIALVKLVIQTIFSLKNSYNQKHKIVTVLGAKLKIKKKRKILERI